MSELGGAGDGSTLWTASSSLDDGSAATTEGRSDGSTAASTLPGDPERCEPLKEGVIHRGPAGVQKAVRERSSGCDQHLFTLIIEV